MVSLNKLICPTQILNFKTFSLIINWAIQDSIRVYLTICNVSKIKHIQASLSLHRHTHLCGHFSHLCGHFFYHTQSVRCDVSILTFQSRNTSRARIRTPARTATSMIHQGTPVCCATVRSGDTVNITWNHYPNKRKLRVKFIFGQQDPSKMCIKAGGFLKVQKKTKTFFILFIFQWSNTYISVRSSQNYVFSLTVKDERCPHNNVHV